ncbi:MAG: 4Fe-4S binding protein [Thermodesulfobacteriota bacterium]|nr:4Fe-4S binding protein [Thermodesulfobacteriota bacterium]
MQPKKVFALVDYAICDPKECAPESGICPAVATCTHKVIKQIDGPFEPPMIFQDMCMGCWDCIETCPLDAISMKRVT